MGLFSSIGKSIGFGGGSNFAGSLGFGGSSDLGRRAAEEERIAREKANVELQSQFDVTAGEFGGQQDQLREDFLRQRGQTEEGFGRFIDIGTAATEELQRGSTPEGFNEILQQIISGGTFKSLIDEQERAAQGQLSAAGLGGSGLGVKELSKISPQLALQLFGDLRGSQQFLSGQGFRGVGQQGQLGNQLFGTQGGLSSGLTRQLGGFRQNLASQRAGNITGSGKAAGAGILTDEQINTQRFNNFLNLLSAGSKFVPGAGGPSQLTG